MKQQIKILSPDILLFQELQANTFDANDHHIKTHWKPLLESFQYMCYFSPEKSETTSTLNTAICWKKDIFTRIDERSLSCISEVLDCDDVKLPSSININNKSFRDELNEKNPSKPLICVLLQHMKTKKLILVVTFHFTANQNVPHLAPLQTILSIYYIDSLRRKYEKKYNNFPPISIIFAGDSNSTSDSPAYLFIENGISDFNEYPFFKRLSSSQLDHSLKLTSAYKLAFGSESITTNTGRLEISFFSFLSYLSFF